MIENVFQNMEPWLLGYPLPPHPATEKATFYGFKFFIKTRWNSCKFILTC